MWQEEPGGGEGLAAALGREVPVPAVAIVPEIARDSEATLNAMKELAKDLDLAKLNAMTSRARLEDVPICSIWSG